MTLDDFKSSPLQPGQRVKVLSGSEKDPEVKLGTVMIITRAVAYIRVMSFINGDNSICIPLYKVKEYIENRTLEIIE